ncbi:hypothetical protein [Aerosakkonema funiforme]|uniref:hypothetical protein n=1 Tax=Aerosakkonema funiforme TaxID=1246630 RepID=UPI0035BAA663
MTRLSDAVSKLLEEFQSPITLSQINERLTNRGPVSFAPIENENPLEILEKLLAERGKKLSQLIAESWLSGKEEYKEKFLLGDEDALKELFIEKGIFDDKLDADRFTIEIRKDVEGPPYIGEITTWGEGSSEIPETKPLRFKLIIPYPVPKPEIEDEELESWINNNDERQLEPLNPLIPLSCT